MKVKKLLDMLSEGKAMSLQDKTIEMSSKIAKVVKSLETEEDKQEYINMLIGNLYGNPITRKYMENKE